MLKLDLIELKLNERYKCTLNKQDLLKAVSELNEPENDEERWLRIDNLRSDFLEQNKNFSPICMDDVFILRFLRARKFHHFRALDLMVNYHFNFLENFPEVGDKLKKPTLVKQLFEGGCFVRIKGKARDGSTVCIGRPGKVENTTYFDYAAAFLISFEHLLKEENVQINGITVIHDMNFLTFQLVKGFPFAARRLLSVVHDAIPMRLKGVIFINEPTAFDLLYSFFSPFLSEKPKKWFKLYGQNFSKLHEIIDPSVLPPDYGGTGDVLDGPVSNVWKDAIFGH